MNENKDVNEGNLPKNKIIRFTPNNLLHSLGNTNKFQGNNRMFINKYSNNNYISTNPTNLNDLQNPSQSSFMPQQKPSLIEVNLFERNNSSYLFDEDPLKQILRQTSDNYFRSSIALDSPRISKSNYINYENFENKIIDENKNGINNDTIL